MRIAIGLAILSGVALAGGADAPAALLAKGEYAKAEAAARALYEKDANNVDALLVVAEALLKQENPFDAADLLEKAETAHPKEARISLKLGDAYVKIAEEELRKSQGGPGLDAENYFLDARQHYENALAKDPKLAAAACGIAYVCYSRDKQDEARDWLSKSLGIQKDYAPAHALQATMFYDAKNYAAAETAYKTARDLDDSDPLVCLRYGHTLYALRKTAEAKAAYIYTLKRHPKYSPAVRVGLLTLASDGKKTDWARARALLEEAAKEAPNSNVAWFYLGYAHFQLGEFDKAADAFAAADKATPNDATTLYWMGYARESAGKAAEALACYRKSLEANPDYEDPALRFAGLAYGVARDIAAAEKLFDELIALAPNNGWVFNNYALLLRDWAERNGGTQDSPPTETKRRLKRSGELYERAAELLKENPQIQSDTGLLFEFYPCNRDDEKALRYFQRSLELSGYLYRDAFDGLYRLATRTGDWEVLKDAAERVVRAIDAGGAAIAPVGGAEPTELPAETPGLRARAQKAIEEAAKRLGE